MKSAPRRDHAGVGLGLALIGAVILAGCGGGSNSGQSASTPTGRVCKTQAHCYHGDIVPTGLPQVLFPDADTPLDKAPAGLRTAWAPLGVTVIPSKHIFDAIPANMTVNNRTNGQVSDADARTWTNAFVRAAALDGWAQSNRQVSFRGHLQAQTLLVDQISGALADGYSVVNPPCALFPTSVDVVAVDDKAKQTYPDVTQAINAKYAMAVTYQGPCRVQQTKNGATTTLFSYPQDGRLSVAGEFKGDPVLGDLWYAEAAAACSATIGASGACA